MESFEPTLTSFDWNEEWKRLQQFRRHTDNAAYWDERSKTFATKDAPNPYVESFLQRACINPGETVFDMGCGTGALSIPLGKAGHKVLAADFSQGMLDRMQETLNEHGIKTVFPKHMSWEDDWASKGVRPGMTDIALASRSIATADLKDSLLRLTDIARRRVCITLATGCSPRIDERVLAAIGLKHALGQDYLYAFNILASEGLRPELSYIESTRTDTFDSLDEAQETFARMVDDATIANTTDTERLQALDRLRDWLGDNLVENEHVGIADKKGVPEKRLRLCEPRKVTWAFLAWDK